MKFEGSSSPFPLDFLAFVVLGVSVTSFSSFLALKEKLLLKFQERINHLEYLTKFIMFIV